MLPTCWQLTLRNARQFVPDGVESGPGALIGLARLLALGLLRRRAKLGHHEVRSGPGPEGLRRYLEWVVADPIAPRSPAESCWSGPPLMATYRVEGRHTEAVAYGRANLAALARVRNPARQPHPGGGRSAGCWPTASKRWGRAERRRRRSAGGAVECLEPRPRRFVPAPWRGGRSLERAEPARRGVRGSMKRSLAAIPRSQGAARVRVHGPPVPRGAPRRLARRVPPVGRGGDRPGCPGATPPRLPTGWRGMACGNLGRLDEAEAHTRTGVRRRPSRSRTTGRRRARSSAAWPTSSGGAGSLAAAQDSGPPGGGAPPEGGSGCRRRCKPRSCGTWGRYDEALAMLRRYRRGGASKVHIPALERRVQAALRPRHGDGSRRNGPGRADAAWDAHPGGRRRTRHRRQSSASSATPRRRGCSRSAGCPTTRAGSPRAGQGSARPNSSKTRAPVAGSSSTWGWPPGPAAIDAEGIACWTELPGPAAPTRSTGRRPFPSAASATGSWAPPPAARADFRQAIALHIDTHHARLAQQRLREVRAGSRLTTQQRTGAARGVDPRAAPVIAQLDSRRSSGLAAELCPRRGGRLP